MSLTPLKKVIIIFLVTLLALYICLPKEINLFGKKIKRVDPRFSIGKLVINRNLDLILGLDLAGGSHLVFDADTSQISNADKKDALESARNIISERVNLFGVSEPNVQVSSFEGKERIVVELPGIKDTKAAVSIIGQTAKLEFRVFVDPGDATSVGATIANTKPTGLTGADFKRATPAFDQSSGHPVISFTIKDGESSKKFADVTTSLKGKPLAIFLDQNAISWPTVQETIQGSGQISGNFSVEGARNFAKLLNAGALPLNLKIVEERTIGATLGAESIKKSVYAGFVGLLMVLIFMVVSYGRMGLIANMALVIFAILTLAIYKLIPVVLTLPGIAGFLLSVGMAVDSNILIFERFKEERPRREYKDALEVSFGRAWDSIRDANVSTIITSLILMNPLDFPFLHTSGPVRGFAITLLLGILISLFTGIVVSRNLLRVFVKNYNKK
jgi:preprotein translocase subunit SecD